MTQMAADWEDRLRLSAPFVAEVSAREVFASKYLRSSAFICVICGSITKCLHDPKVVEAFDQ